MKIYLATDHAGYELKEAVKKHLREKDFEVEDVGALIYDKEDDYPDFIFPLARKIARDKDARGIIFGGSGQGEAMAANRVRGVRAAVYYGGEEQIITLSREHNDANILSIGARFVKENKIMKLIEFWLGTAFSRAARHQRRINKLDEA